MRNEYPHITIGMAPRVNPVVSNELLARRAAAEDLQTGLQANVLDDRSRRCCGIIYCKYCFIHVYVSQYELFNYVILLYCVRVHNDDRLPVAWSWWYEGRELEGNPEICLIS